MKKKLIALSLTVCMILFSAACENSTEASDLNDAQEAEEIDVSTSTKETSNIIDINKTEDESTEQDNEYNIDIDQCIENLKSELPLEPDYTYVNDYFISSDKKDLTISIIVDDATSPESALDFADTVVRQLNLYACMQDSNIAPSSKDFYGGLYEEYTALVGVAPASKVNNPDEWFVYDAIVGGKVMLKLK